MGLTDFDDDAILEIVTGAGPLAGLPVQVLDSQTLGERDSFFAFEDFARGVFVS